jgi:hypothetical protein
VVPELGQGIIPMIDKSRGIVPAVERIERRNTLGVGGHRATDAGSAPARAINLVEAFSGAFIGSLSHMLSRMRPR